MNAEDTCTIKNLQQFWDYTSRSMLWLDENFILKLHLLFILRINISFLTFKLTCT